jgi:hypothetical protein
LRAAALALRRDFNVNDAQLKLAARSVGAASGHNDRVLIAYTTQSQRAEDSVDARWFEAAKGDAIYWLGAPNGVALSSAGAAAIEHWSLADGVPAPIMALIAQSIGSGAGSGTRLLIDDADGHFDQATLELWRASLGIAVERGALPGIAQPIPLLPPPAAALSVRNAAFDRALVACACVAALAALLSTARYAMLPSIELAARAAGAAGSTATASRANTASGELWASATLASPVLAETMKSASYGGGAWVIAAPSLDRAILPSMATALTANGLAVQTIVDPEPRVRVQKP